MQPLERLARGIYWDPLPRGGVLYLPESPTGPAIAVELEIVVDARGGRGWWRLEGSRLLPSIPFGLA